MEWGATKDGEGKPPEKEELSFAGMESKRIWGNVVVQGIAEKQLAWPIHDSNAGDHLRACTCDKQ